MAKPINTLVLTWTLAAILFVATVNGDAAAAATNPTTICHIKVSELAECIPAITGKSPPGPTKKCCSVMRKANLHCLCNYKSGFVKYGIDPKNAIALPGKCGRKLPRECKN